MSRKALGRGLSALFTQMQTSESDLMDIDIDLLYCNNLTLETNRLTLPHPRIEGRRFVLRPLADIQAERVLPGQTRTIRELLASAAQTGKVLRATVQWEV